MATIALVLSVLTIFATYVCFVNGQSSCSSGDVCKSLYECSPLLDIIKKPDKTQADIDFLSRSRCGFDANVPKVCCPNSCVTPNGKAGKCVSIYSCSSLVSLLKPPVSQQNMQFVQNSKCPGQDQFSVCCGAGAPDQKTMQALTPQQCAASVSAFPPDPKTKCCGVDGSFGNRIVGGTSTSIDEYPWMLLIEYIRDGVTSLLCGGALISGRYGLTAAHCVTGDIVRNYLPANVRLGEYDTSNDGRDCAKVEAGGTDCTPGIVVIPIQQIIAHPDYSTNKKNSPYDIALLRLQQMAPFTDFIRPICLPTTDVTLNPPPPENFTLYSAGWGVVSVRQPFSNVKLHVGLPYVPRDVCQSAYRATGRNHKLIEGQMCAGGEEGKDSCKGDSGGPLMYENDKTWEALGVVSFGPTPCGQLNLPGVYTKVYEYNAWIKSVIRP